MENKYKILILGPQGSGKGTQAQLLSDKLNIPALSMGQLLRDEVASDSDLGKYIGEIINRGELVSDEVALNVLKLRLQKKDAEHGYVLDGYPRNFAQFQTFNNFDVPTALIVISVPQDETLKRLIKRAEIEGRADDNEETILKRLAIYNDDTKPIINKYRELGIVHEIDGMGTIEDVASRIDESLAV
jgi:adenylate kinase